jgi:hypothetical protein
MYTYDDEWNYVYGGGGGGGDGKVVGLANDSRVNHIF